MNTMNYTHIILGGGGLKGLHYIGVYRYLKQNNLLSSLKNVVGCSIGSLFAYMFALDLSVEELEKYIFKSLSNPKHTVFTINDIHSIYTNKGLFDINRLRNVLTDAFYLKYNQKVNNLTFLEFTKLTGKNIFISTYQLTNSEVKMFSNIDDPEVDIFDAILSSMTIPFVFQPIKINNEIYLDGAINNAFPINHFNFISSDKILGINIIEIINKSIIDNFETPFDYFKNVLFQILLHRAGTKYLNKYKDMSNFDLLSINSTLPVINTTFLHNKISISIGKNLYDEAICYGYNQMYTFIKNKSKDSV